MRAQSAAGLKGGRDSFASLVAAAAAPAAKSAPLFLLDSGKLTQERSGFFKNNHYYL